MKNTFWSNPWFVIPVLIFLNIGLLLLLFIPYGDEILHLNRWRTEPLNSFFRGSTKLGEWMAFIAFAMLAMLWRFRYAVLILFAGLLVIPTSYLMKDKIGIDRPITYFEKAGLRNAVVVVPNIKLHGGQTSFPSGHTMAAFTLYALIAFMTSRAAPLLGLACAWTAFLVALSRVFLVQHFLVDILGGAFVGLLIAWLAYSVDKRFLSRFTKLDSGFLPKKQHLP